MLLKHEGIAAGECRSKSVALLGGLPKDATPVVFLVLGFAGNPPAGIDIPWPPANAQRIRLFPVLLLVRVRFREQTVRILFHIKVEQKVEREQVAKVTGTNKDDSAQKGPVKRANAKIYPNDPCPCGSGKKYKACHGRKGFTE